MKQIAKQWWAGVKSIGVETAETAKSEALRMTEGIITGKDWLGDIKPMGDEQYQQVKNQDRAESQKEIEQIRGQLAGRNVDREIEEVRRQKTEEEEEQERFLEQLQRQREAEKAEQAAMWAGFGESNNPAKRKKKRGSAFATGKHGKASQADMSETGEFKGGKVD